MVSWPTGVCKSWERKKRLTESGQDGNLGDEK